MPAALVTGASSGIGRAIAADLVAAGWDVSAVSRDPGRGAPAGTLPVACDLAHEEECVRAVAVHAERFGRLDLLVCAAGLYLRGAVAETTGEGWQRQMDVNARAPLVLARESIPLLVAARGQIAIVASLLGVEGGSAMAAYAASKHAAVGLVRSLNLELNGRGVRATAICPAFVATPMVEWSTVPPEEMIQPADVARVVRMLVELTPACVIEQLVVRRTSEVPL